MFVSHSCKHECTKASCSSFCLRERERVTCSALYFTVTERHQVQSHTGVQDSLNRDSCKQTVSRSDPDPGCLSHASRLCFSEVCRAERLQREQAVHRKQPEDSHSDSSSEAAQPYMVSGCVCVCAAFKICKNVSALSCGKCTDRKAPAPAGCGLLQPQRPGD